VCFPFVCDTEQVVSTVGRDEAVIRHYIRTQEAEDQRLEQLGLWR
jgi:putative transposase